MGMRYYCFSYDEFYPSGGMGDCQLTTNDLEEARVWLSQSDWYRSQVWDTVTCAEVEW